MTSTNDGKDVKSNQTSAPKGKTYYIELYKSLDARLNAEGDLSARTDAVSAAWRSIHALCQHSAPSTQTHLNNWIQRHTARTFLQSEWQSPQSKSEHTKLEEAINLFIEECNAAASTKDGVYTPWEEQLLPRAEWFKSVLANPWGHPVLKVLLDPKGKKPSSEEILEWLKEERGVVFASRLRQLALSKCDDLALELITVVMDRVRQDRVPVNDLELFGDTKVPQAESTTPTFESILSTAAGFSDVWDLLTDMEFVLLHKRDKNSRLIDLVKLTPLTSAEPLVERLLNRLKVAPREKKIWKNAKDVAMLISQVMIARCMVVPQCRGGVARALRGCGCALSACTDERRLPRTTALLAAPAATAAHLYTLAAAVHAHQSSISKELKPFVVELYVRAITFGMNELEKLKLEPDKEKEARQHEKTLASWFVALGGLLSERARVRCECSLTAFSVHPSTEMYELIQRAPPLSPVVMDTEPKTEKTATSDFGSWANDSRSQTNFVKTSETLNLKQTQNQANVLSTAILTEGEMLGLEPELCQDIAVLLSGPRVKTLSWDMDRELLLENCRAYMERTHGGTKAVTTELKYLNLDVTQFQHLPEEEDDENDAFYGIEKGYEHLVELQEPEPEQIWEDAFDLQRTDSACSSEEYSQGSQSSRRKRKSKHQTLKEDSDSETDPLSSVAEMKRAEKKKERPHSKERSKERKKKTKELKETSDKRKDKDGDKIKKKEKKERKKREKKEKKSAKLSSAVLLAEKDIFIDSDYDSQGKSSLNSEGNDPNVLYDGQFSMDDIKSPSSLKSPDNNRSLYNRELTVSNGKVDIQRPVSVNNKTEQYPNAKHSATPHLLSHYNNAILSKSVQEVREDVKKSITKLIQFRRNKALEAANNASMVKTNEQSQTTPTQSTLTKAQAQQIVHFNKQQAEKLMAMKNKAQSFQTSPTKTLHPELNEKNNGPRTIPYDPYKPVPSTNVLTKPVRPPLQSPYFVPPSVSLNSPSTHLSSYERFLQELQGSHNAGVNKIPVNKTEKRKVVKPVHRVNPVVPPVVSPEKPESTTSPYCAKPIQQKKADNAPNTFSRLSYMHKNKQVEKPKETLESLNHALQNSISEELDKRIADLKFHKAKMGISYSATQSSATLVEKQVNVSKVPENEKDVVLKNLLRGSAVTVKKKPNEKEPPLNNNMCSERSPSQTTPKSKTSLLTEKDNQDIVRLLGQKNALNPQVKQNPGTSIPVSTAYATKQESMHTTKYIGLKIPVAPYSDHIATSSQDKIVDRIQKPMVASNPKCPTISKSSILKTVEQIQTNRTAQTVSKERVPKNKKITNTFTMDTKIVPVIKTAPKTYVPKPPVCTPKLDEDWQQQNWEKVLDVLRSHKTPSRGPNALDMVLKKDSFEKVEERNQGLKSIRTDSYNKTAEAAVQAKLAKPASSVSKAKATDNAHKSQVMQCGPKAQESPFGVPGSHKTPKIQVPQNKTPAMNPLIIFPEVVAKEQYPPQIQKDDPFISGLPNPDYDILDELIDDDLRKEIGELSSDEESYRSSNSTSLKNQKVNAIVKKCNLIEKPIQNRPKQKVDTHIVSHAGAKATINTASSSKPVILSNEKVDLHQVQNMIVSSGIRISNPPVQTPKTVYNTFNHSETINETPNSLNQTNLYYNGSSQPVTHNIAMYEPYTINIQNTPTGYPKPVIISNFEVDAPVSAQFNIAQNYSVQPVPTVIHQNVTVMTAPTLVIPSVIVQTNPAWNMQPQQPFINVMNNSEVIQPKSQIDVNNDNKLKSEVEHKTSQENTGKLIKDKTNERKVLSEVQEKLKEPVPTPAVQNVTSDSYKDKERFREERLAQKRIAIVNRNINVQSPLLPIALSYTPLVSKPPVEKSLESTLINVAKVKKDTNNSSVSKPKSVDTTSAKSLAKTITLTEKTEEANKNENSKENAQLFNNIVLRSNKSTPMVSTPVNDKSVGRKTKVRLKFTPKAAPKTKKENGKLNPKTSDANTNKDRVISTRVSKRILNKKSNKCKDIDAESLLGKSDIALTTPVENVEPNKGVLTRKGNDKAGTCMKIATDIEAVLPGSRIEKLDESPKPKAETKTRVEKKPTSEHCVLPSTTLNMLASLESDIETALNAITETTISSPLPDALVCTEVFSDISIAVDDIPNSKTESKAKDETVEKITTATKDAKLCKEPLLSCYVPVEKLETVNKEVAKEPVLRVDVPVEKVNTGMENSEISKEQISCGDKPTNVNTVTEEAKIPEEKVPSAAILADKVNAVSEVVKIPKEQVLIADEPIKKVIAGTEEVKMPKEQVLCTEKAKHQKPIIDLTEESEIDMIQEPDKEKSSEVNTVIIPDPEAKSLLPTAAKIPQQLKIVETKKPKEVTIKKVENDLKQHEKKTDKQIDAVIPEPKKSVSVSKESKENLAKSQGVIKNDKERKSKEKLSAVDKSAERIGTEENLSKQVADESQKSKLDDDITEIVEIASHQAKTQQASNKTKELPNITQNDKERKSKEKLSAVDKSAERIGTEENLSKQVADESQKYKLDDDITEIVEIASHQAKTQQASEKTKELRNITQNDKERKSKEKLSAVDKSAERIGTEENLSKQVADQSQKYKLDDEITEIVEIASHQAKTQQASNKTKELRNITQNDKERKSKEKLSAVDKSAERIGTEENLIKQVADQSQKYKLDDEITEIVEIASHQAKTQQASNKTKELPNITQNDKDVVTINIPDSPIKPNHQKSNKNLNRLPQSFKDKIKVVEIPIPGNTDPNRKCVRIKLPNKLVIKATFRGIADINMLLDDPGLQKILMETQDKASFTVTIPNSLHVAENTDCTKLTETVNLISDDEEDVTMTQKFKTDSGTYIVNNIEQSTFAQHQKKLAQKCSVNLFRCDAKPKNKSLVDAIDSFVLPMKEVTEVIEIDDSSDSDVSPVEEGTIAILKDSLLKDLGINLPEIQSSQQPECQSGITKRPEKSKESSRVQISTSKASKKPAIITKDCYIKLVRCDYLLHTKEIVDSDVTVIEDDEDKDSIIILSPTASVTILSDIPAIDEHLGLDDGDRSPVINVFETIAALSNLENIDCGRNSPVMEAFDMIASLKNNAVTTVDPKVPVIKNNYVKCESEWLMTKRQGCALCSDLNESYLDCKDTMTDCENYVSDLNISDVEKLITNHHEVPSLISILSKYFEGNDLVHILTPKAPVIMHKIRYNTPHKNKRKACVENECLNYKISKLSNDAYNDFKISKERPIVKDYEDTVDSKDIGDTSFDDIIEIDQSTASAEISDVTYCVSPSILDDVIIPDSPEVFDIKTEAQNPINNSIETKQEQNTIDGNKNLCKADEKQKTDDTDNDSVIVPEPLNGNESIFTLTELDTTSSTVSNIAADDESTDVEDQTNLLESETHKSADEPVTCDTTYFDGEIKDPNKSSPVLTNVTSSEKLITDEEVNNKIVCMEISENATHFDGEIKEPNKSSPVLTNVTSSEKLITDEEVNNKIVCIEISENATHFDGEIKDPNKSSPVLTNVTSSEKLITDEEVNNKIVCIETSENATHFDGEIKEPNKSSPVLTNVTSSEKLITDEEVNNKIVCIETSENATHFDGEIKEPNKSSLVLTNVTSSEKLITDEEVNNKIVCIETSENAIIAKLDVDKEISLVNVTTCIKKPAIDRIVKPAIQTVDISNADDSEATVKCYDEPMPRISNTEIAIEKDETSKENMSIATVPSDDEPMLTVPLNSGVMIRECSKENHESSKQNLAIPDIKISSDKDITPEESEEILEKLDEEIKSDVNHENKGSYTDLKHIEPSDDNALVHNDSALANISNDNIDWIAQEAVIGSDTSSTDIPLGVSMESSENGDKVESVGNSKLVQTDMQNNNNENVEINKDHNYLYETEVLVEEVETLPNSDLNCLTPINESDKTDVIEVAVPKTISTNNDLQNDIEVEKSIREIDCDAHILEKNATLIYKDDSGVVLKGIEYEDPELGTCFVFPIAKDSSADSSKEILNDSSESMIEVMQEVESTASPEPEEQDSEDHKESFELKVLEPKTTYLKNSLKRQADMSDVDLAVKRSKRNSKCKELSDTKTAEKRYRKGKNIDFPKLTTSSIASVSYAKEYKRLFDYYTSVDFSYSLSYSAEFIDVPNLLRNWPIKQSTPIETDVEDNSKICLFTDFEDENTPNSDPLSLTLADEIMSVEENPEYKNNSEIKESNFNMGFGEGSGRVIQNLNANAISKFSAATLSDVKQFQPCLFSKNGHNTENRRIFCDPSIKDQIDKIQQFVSFVNLREKVRSFFKNTAIELAVDQKKDSFKDDENETSFPFELYVPRSFGSRQFEAMVQVVQVGQLPVSAAAQNPVTCDPRVTQVSDASPSQCSAENSPNDDSHQDIKTEYTELTTADLSLPLVDDYGHNNHTMPMQPQDANNSTSNIENIPIETEIVKSEVKIELDGEEKENPTENNRESETNKHVNEYMYENNHTNTSVDSDIQALFNPDKPASTDGMSQQNTHNGSNEKTDQIAHAMSAAGITTTESITNPNTRAHALVNIISQKIRQGVVSSQNSNTANHYPKATTINAMALQQALAQILPPPLNQTNSSDSNQQGQNSVTPQVLHIVQGKNSSGNQITLVDNTQQSVINTPNATSVLHIVQNKSVATGPTSNGSPAPQSNTFSGISLVDAGLQQGGNQLLHIVNTGNQKNNNAGQLLKRVNLLTNLTNVQGSNEQKMVQFVCKSADGKSIQLNAPHQRSMVLRLQPIETPNVQQQQQQPAKPPESQDLSPTPNNVNSVPNKDNNSQQEIKSRSVYEENYAKFIQNSSNSKPTLLDKPPSLTPTHPTSLTTSLPTSHTPTPPTSLPKFNQAFGKQVFQDNNQKQNDISNSNSNLTSVSNNVDNTECPSSDNSINLDHMGQISSPPLLLRKPQTATTQSPPNLVQQIKQTIAPMNIQTMHGGVIYTRQIPVNIGGGQTINLITVPSTELVDENGQKQVNQSDIEPSIIKIVPQSQAPPNAEVTPDTMNSNNENNQNPQPQPVLTQMRIKLPMLSKAPQLVSGARVVRPSFFQIQRNVIGGANQPVYQQLVLTAAPPLGQQTIRLPQAQAKQIKVPESQSPSESQMSSSTLEQLREFDMVLEQVKERSTVQPNASASTASSSFKLHASSSDTTDSSTGVSSTPAETTQVLYSIGSSQSLNVAYVNRKPSSTPTTSTYVRSPDSSGIADSPSSSSHSQIPHTVTTESTSSETTTQPKPVKCRPTRTRHKSSSNPPMKVNPVPPKPSTQKPLEDEQTTQRILYILAEYKEQVENSPDKDKPAPRRRSNPPSNPSGSSKRKKSSSGSRKSGGRDVSPTDDSCRTMGSEDSSCGTSQGDCNENCLETTSPQDSPRKVARKITFEPETPAQQRPQPQRNVIVADGQTITVARGTAGKPATAVLMPANYILPVSMVKGGQQIAIVTNRGPKLLTVGGGEGGATNALLLQRLIGPAGLKPMLARPGVRHVRLPTAALHNLQAFNLATATSVQPPDSTASPASEQNPPDLVDTRAEASPWGERESESTKPDRASSPDESEPWNLPSSADAHDYSYEETVRTDNMNRTVLDPIQDRYSPDMEAQRIFDKMFDVDSKKSYIGDSQVDSPRCGYDIDASDCDDKPYQVVQKKDSTSRHTRLAHVSAAALRHKYAILEHELRLQKSLSEECEDLGVDSPSASELFPEAELLFAASPAQDHAPDTPQHSHTPQPPILNQSAIQPDIDDQIATDQLIQRTNIPEGRQEIDVNLGLEDVGMVTVSEDGMQATIALDQEEFARSHPNTTFHSEPTDEGEVQPFTIAGLKTRHITSTIFHSNRAPATVLMTTPQTTVISQATAETSAQNVKYSDLDNMINSLPSTHTNNINLSSVLVKDDGLTRFDSILTDSRELHLSNTASAIIHPSGNATQVIRRVGYDENKRERERFLIDEPDALIAGDDAKMIAEDSSRDATLESMAGDDENSSPERHAELFWESNSASERSESRRPLDFSSDSEKCCKSPSYDETNSTDSSGVGTQMRLDSVIKEARLERSGSADGSSAEDTHPPLRTYPPKRLYHAIEGDMERSLSGKTRAGERSPDLEIRRRASGRGVVKRGCHCCNGSPAPQRPKKPRQRKPTLDFIN